MKLVSKFTMHNDRGQSVLDSDLTKWVDPTNKKNDIFGPIVRYSWQVDGINYGVQRPKNSFWYLLPDCTGFICFERNRKPNNSILLDAYGKERMRLTVPWQLTRHPNPESAKPPTSFAIISSPCVNPTNGKLGQFGVSAWVEYAGMYYFELDYHTGQFLWGREIRD